MKKSKFQEKLEAAARKQGILPVEDEMENQSQTAQLDWKSTDAEKPPYYVCVHILLKDMSIRHNWHRLSDGDIEYYCDCDTSNNSVIPGDEILLWSPPDGVLYPKYEPLTASDLEEYFSPNDMNKLITALKKKKIPYQTMTSWNRNHCEGINEGINLCIKMIERRLKKRALK